MAFNVILIRCMCVCGFFPFILDIKFVRRTSRGRSALIFLARRIQPFLSLVDRKVDFFVLKIQSFSTCSAFIFILFIFQ